jgi:hypothetical protein
VGKSELKFHSYFIGGGPELKDMSFIRKPSSQIPVTIKAIVANMLD